MSAREEILLKSARDIGAYTMPYNYSSSGNRWALIQMMSRAKLRDKDGNWNVPYANWNGTKWNRNANWLTNDWNSNYRVVLLDTRVGPPPAVAYRDPRPAVFF